MKGSQGASGLLLVLETEAGEWKLLKSQEAIQRQQN